MIPRLPEELHTFHRGFEGLQHLAPLLKPDDEAIRPEDFLGMACARFISVGVSLPVRFELAIEGDSYLGESSDRVASPSIVVVPQSVVGVSIGDMLTKLPTALAEGICFYLHGVDVLGPANYEHQFQIWDWRGEGDEFDTLTEYLYNEGGKCEEFVKSIERDRTHPRTLDQWDAFYKNVDELGFEGCGITQWREVQRAYPAWALHPKQPKNRDRFFTILEKRMPELARALDAFSRAKLPRDDDITYPEWDREIPWPFIAWMTDQPCPVSHSIEEMENYTMQTTPVRAALYYPVKDIHSAKRKAEKIRDYYEAAHRLFTALSP